MSIISPGNLINFQTHNATLNLLNNNKSSKLYVKQSYMLLTWVLYLKNLYLKQSPSSSKASLPSFFVFPKNVKKITLLKAPMAHKTFSQEQFLFKFYVLSISYSIENPNSSNLSFPSSSSSFNHNTTLKDSLFFILKQRAFFTTDIGTNLFFFKKATFKSTWNSSTFFKLV